MQHVAVHLSRGLESPRGLGRIGRVIHHHAGEGAYGRLRGCSWGRVGWVSGHHRSFHWSLFEEDEVVVGPLTRGPSTASLHGYCHVPVALVFMSRSLWNDNRGGSGSSGAISYNIAHI